MQNLPAIFDNWGIHETRAEAHQKTLKASIRQLLDPVDNYHSNSRIMNEMHRHFNAYKQYVLENCSNELFRSAYLYFAETYASGYHLIRYWVFTLTISLRFSMSHCLMSDGLMHIRKTKEADAHIDVARAILDNALAYFSVMASTSKDHVKIVEQLEKLAVLIDSHVKASKGYLLNALHIFKKLLNSPDHDELIDRIERLQNVRATLP